MERDLLIAEIKKQLQEELKLQAKTWADKIPDPQKHQLKEFKKDLSEFVKKHPLPALTLAVIAGFALGRILYKKGNGK